MIIVSDTTPFRYLLEIEAIEILGDLFGNVIIPQAVAEELQHPRTPQKVKDWIQSPPNWLEIRQADLSFFTPLNLLDRGETEAIAIALELRADAILIDEAIGRAEAKRVGLFILPTLTILERAAVRGLLDLPETIAELSKTSFRVSPKLIQEILERDHQRKQEMEKNEDPK